MHIGYISTAPHFLHTASPFIPCLLEAVTPSHVSLILFFAFSLLLNSIYLPPSFSPFQSLFSVSLSPFFFLFL